MAIGYVRAVVFGGGGFIGRHLVRRLSNSGAVVSVPSRHVSRLGHLRTAGVVGQVVPEIMSTFDDDELAAAITGCDVVINLIGILAESRRDSFERLHAALPGRVAAVAAAVGAKRLIHVSALGADAHSPSAYARSKAAGEAAVLDAFPRATIIRPSIVFGPEDQFFNRFAGMSMISPALPLIGGGHTRFQPVYVGDVGRGIMAAMLDPATAGKLYEFGGPRIYSFRDLMETMLSQIGAKRLLVPVPWGLAHVIARFAQLLPGAPLTPEQVELLKHDNVMSPSALGLADLGILPTAPELILPTYMDRFRKGGRTGPQMRTAA
jgi:uncharacterized protein YbjT (DUF2867 family)